VSFSRKKRREGKRRKRSGKAIDHTQVAPFFSSKEKKEKREERENVSPAYSAPRAVSVSHSV